MTQDPRKQLNDSKLLSSHGWGAAVSPKKNWRKILLLWTLLLLSSSLRLVIILLLWTPLLSSSLRLVIMVEEITKGRGGMYFRQMLKLNGFLPKEKKSLQLENIPFLTLKL